jgi:branched-chain amino acid transport system substrate-binding protein
VAYDTANLLNIAVKNVNGKTDNKEALVAAVKAASVELKSVRGPFKFGTNNMPVQNYYAFQTVKEGSVITVKQLSTPLAQHPDVYAALCKAK